MPDNWGRDPSVRFMRSVFGSLEEAQKAFFVSLNISFFDPRLRRWREEARNIFDQVWPQAMTRGLVSSEKDASLLYLHCLERSLKLNGIEIPNGIISNVDEIHKLVEQVVP